MAPVRARDQQNNRRSRGDGTYRGSGDDGEDQQHHPHDGGAQQDNADQGQTMGHGDQNFEAFGPSLWCRC